MVKLILFPLGMPETIGHSSGDTGVSASLTLHGTPPFQVYYRIQRDQEPPQELPKTFATSRGELTLQPDRSGHYTFTFVQISDAHYKRVELNGPSIDQVIHPPAGADFVTTTTYQSGKRRKISSCEGNTVSVDVDLKVLTTSFYRFVFNDVALRFLGNRSLESRSPSCWSQKFGHR